MCTGGTVGDAIYVSAAEAAVWTGRPKGTIWRWASEGRINRYEIGGSVKYLLDELPPLTDAGPATPPPLPPKTTDREVIPA